MKTLIAILFFVVMFFASATQTRAQDEIIPITLDGQNTDFKIHPNDNVGWFGINYTDGTASTISITQDGTGVGQLTPGNYQYVNGKNFKISISQVSKTAHVKVVWIGSVFHEVTW